MTSLLDWVVHLPHHLEVVLDMWPGLQSFSLMPWYFQSTGIWKAKSCVCYIQLLSQSLWAIMKQPDSFHPQIYIHLWMSICNLHTLMLISDFPTSFWSFFSEIWMRFGTLNQEIKSFIFSAISWADNLMYQMLCYTEPSGKALLETVGQRQRL